MLPDNLDVDAQALVLLLARSRPWGALDCTRVVTNTMCTVTNAPWPKRPPPRRRRAMAHVRTHMRSPTADRQDDYSPAQRGASMRSSLTRSSMMPCGWRMAIEFVGVPRRVRRYGS